MKKRYVEFADIVKEQLDRALLQEDTLDEMSRIMVQVGGQISKELGMCCNGCCLTPTGTRLAQEQSK